MAEERAVLAGGCFWGMQDLIRRLPGVTRTRVGYTGGDVANATYRNHGTHAEGIEIWFDPAKTSYRRLLEFFFQIHDPTTPNRQGNDIGMSYRSAIYYCNDAQKAEALDTIADVLKITPSWLLYGEERNTQLTPEAKKVGKLWMRLSEREQMRIQREIEFIIQSNAMLHRR